MISALNAQERRAWLSIFSIALDKRYHNNVSRLYAKDVVDDAADVADLSILALRERTLKKRK